MPRATGWLEHAGERIYYEIAGSAGAPWLILCHGAGGNHAVWHHQVAHFCGSYRVLVWDQRGFGRSTNRGGAASPQAAATDLAALVAELGIRRAHVVGQSMGGWAAMGFCVAHSGVAVSLTLADTLGGIPVAAWAAGRLSPRPVLFVVGGDDEIFPPAWIAEAAGNLARATVEEIPGAGHSPYFEVPDEWNAVVARHLDAASRG